MYEVLLMTVFFSGPPVSPDLHYDFTDYLHMDYVLFSSFCSLPYGAGCLRSQLRVYTPSMRHDMHSFGAISRYISMPFHVCVTYTSELFVSCTRVW
jgi:hypothetical protein